MSSESGVISPELADIWRVLVKLGCPAAVLTLDIDMRHHVLRDVLFEQIDTKSLTSLSRSYRKTVENYRFYKFRVDILRRIAEYITTSVVFYSPRR